MTQEVETKYCFGERAGLADTAGELKRLRLIPDGRVPSRIRPFTLDRAAADRIIARFNEHETAIEIDYEHQSLGGKWAAPDGLAKAAGWVEELEYVEGNGLYGKVKWTAQAREMIQADQYRYLSPTLLIHKKTGELMGMDSVGLTNKPAIPGMGRVAASERFTRKEANAMPDEEPTATGGPDPKILVGEIKALLNIELDPGADIVDVLGAILEKVKSGKGPDKPKDEGDDAAPADGAVANSVRKALGLKDGACGSEVVLAIHALKQGSGVAAATLEELAELRGKFAEREAKELVEPYIVANKLNPNDTDAMEAALDMAKTNPEALHALMANATPYCQSGRTQPPEGGTASTKSREQTLIANSLKEHKGDHAEAIVALQIELKQPYIDQGLTSKAANEACAREYPVIFAT